MHIVAFGAGGVGGYFGAKLALSGVDVTFVARGAHLEAIQKNGLTIQSPEGDMLVKSATATDDVAAIDPPDYLFFAVKLFDTETVAEACRPIVGPDTTVVSLQNGVEAVGILNGVFGRNRVMGGTVGVATVISLPSANKTARIRRAARHWSQPAIWRAPPRLCRKILTPISG